MQPLHELTRPVDLELRFQPKLHVTPLPDSFFLGLLNWTVGCEQLVTFLF